jgi:hypothetical protein
MDGVLSRWPGLTTSPLVIWTLSVSQRAAALSEKDMFLLDMQ